MKQYISLVVLVSFTLIFAGCSKDSSSARSTPRAIDLVQAGKDIEFGGGYVVRVAKREENSLEGIRILAKASNGQASEITAATGTIKPGTPEQPNFENQLTMTLHNAKIVTGLTKSTASSVVVVLYK